MPLDATTSTQTRALSLADAAQHSLRDTFASANHAPSGEQWAAISDLLEHLERAADDKLSPAVYLSAIPAGTGKSTSLAAFANALMADPSRADVGMLITCNRVSEVADMARDLQRHRDKLCVVVSADHRDGTETLALADHQEAATAQVVVSTQAALKASLKGDVQFDDASRFHYLGRRRAVVCWDEAISFNRPVVLDPDAALALVKALGAQSRVAAIALKTWSLALETAPDGQCDVPDFAALGIDFRRLEGDTETEDNLSAQARMLAVVSGGTAYVMRDLNGATLISHVPELPSSLMPVIVTDASAARGVHHASYEQMANNRPVVWLKEAGKTYRSMKLRLVPIAASRSAYREQAGTKARDLVNMAVTYIRSVAPEPVLVVSYRNWFRMKGLKERTIREAVDAQLGDAERARVRHLTWGTHTATNSHRDVKHVLLMGLNFLPRSASYAAAGAALNKAMRTGAATDHPTAAQVAEMRVGMLRDATLQALLRGNARKAVDGDCGPMEAVIFQTSQTGLAWEDYQGMFPGVVVSDDRSLLPAKPLKGKLKALGSIVAARLAAGETQMLNTALGEQLGMDATAFRRLLKHPAWLEHIASIGLSIVPLNGRALGHVRR